MVRAYPPGSASTGGATGATLLFLPQYSPDINPIERLFARLKHWLRNAAERTRDAVCNASPASSPPFQQPKAPTISPIEVTPKVWGIRWHSQLSEATVLTNLS